MICNLQAAQPSGVDSENPKNVFRTNSIESVLRDMDEYFSHGSGGAGTSCTREQLEGSAIRREPTLANQILFNHLIPKQ